MITLDELPMQVAPGQALTLRDDLLPLLHFARADTTESFTVTARREGTSGQYTTSVTFPSSGAEARHRHA